MFFSSRYPARDRRTDERTNELATRNATYQDGRIKKQRQKDAWQILQRPGVYHVTRNIDTGSTQ